MGKYGLSSFLVVVALATAIQSGVVPEGKAGAKRENQLIFLGSSINQVPGKLRGTTISQESLYFHSTNNAAFAAARADCEAFLGPDATLLIIETQEELANVTAYLRSSDDTASTFWVGAGYDTSKATFMWENDVEVGPWAPWAPGHPNSRTSITKVAINAVGSVQFRTQFQTQTTRYLCELKLGVEEAVPCYSDNDLVIVVDSSGSIGELDYMAALEFTAKLAIAWADNPGNRLSVVVYATDAISVINMNEALNVNQIRDRVYNAPYFAGSTYSDKGLNLALTQITSNDRAVPKNIVFLTDGGSSDPPATIAAAQAVQNAGVRAFAVGIKSGVNPTELLAIAGNNPNHVFNTDSFQELFTLLQPVSRQVCD